MHEHVITNLSKDEIKRLEESTIDWYVDDVFGNDVVIEGDITAVREALTLIGRAV